MANKAKKRGRSWRVLVYDYTDEAGKKHLRSFTAPTKAEAELLAAEFMRTKRERVKAVEAGTVGSLVAQYIEMMEPTLSPSTITVYRRAQHNAFPELMQMPVAKLTAQKVQAAINAEVARPKQRTGRPLSPKTIRNEWGLVSVALSELAGLRFSPKLPTYQVHRKDLPEPAEVIKAVSGTDVELPVMLALCLSLTMSEIRGLKCSDISDGVLTINRVMVDTDNGPVLKDTAKTATRLRKLVLPPFLWQLINLSTAYQNWLKTGSDGLVEPRGRAAIYHRYQRIMQKAGITMTFHDLRALNASTMLALGVPDLYAMERGGWKTPAVMKTHYQQTLNEKRRSVDASINQYFESITRQITKTAEKR